MTRYGVVDVREITSIALQEFVNKHGKPILMNNKFLIVVQED